MSLRLNLGNAGYWVRFYSQEFQVSYITAKEYRPLDPIILPTQVENRIIVAGCTSETAKRTWRFGGRLIPLIQTGGPFIDAEIESYPVFLNIPRLIILPDLGTTYKLRFETPYWFEQINLTIFEYIGPIGDTTELLLSQGFTDIQTTLATKT